MRHRAGVTIRWWAKASGILDKVSSMKREVTFATREECDEFTSALKAHGGVFVYRWCNCSFCYQPKSLKKVRARGVLAYGEFITVTNRKQRRIMHTRAMELP